MITNKRNIVTVKIVMCFLVARNDALNPHFCTSKPSEHNFGNWILEKREATTHEMVELEEKAQRRNKAVYKEGFKIYCSEKKGYHSISPIFVNHSKDATTTEEFGGSEGEKIDYTGNATVTTIWKLIQPIIMACNKNVSSLLKIFGVNEVEMSPFLKYFESPSAILKAYIDYLSGTFKYSMYYSLKNNNIAPDRCHCGIASVINFCPHTTRRCR